MAVRDGSCLRRDAGPGSIARFETHIEPNPIRAVSQLSKASYKPPAGRGAFARFETHFEPNSIQAASMPVKASKLHVRPHEAAWWDGSCDRMAARRGAYARFETRLEPNPIRAVSQLSKASYKPPKCTFRDTETARQ